MRRTRDIAACRAHAWVAQATSIVCSLSVGCARALIPAGRRPCHRWRGLPGPGVPRGGRRPARRDRVRRDLGVRAARRGCQAGTDARGQGGDRQHGDGGVRPRRAAHRAARPARRRPLPGDGAVRGGDRPVPRAHRTERLVRGADQGLRRRRHGERLLPRDRGVPRHRDAGPGRGLARGQWARRLRRRPGPRRHRGGPSPRWPARPVGPPVDGGGPHPGSAGRRRPRRAVRAPGRRCGPPGPGPRRDRADVRPDHRAARGADGRGGRAARAGPVPLATGRGGARTAARAPPPRHLGGKTSADKWRVCPTGTARSGVDYQRRTRPVLPDATATSAAATTTCHTWRHQSTARLSPAKNSP